jgi:hypothetical protein
MSNLRTLDPTYRQERTAARRDDNAEPSLLLVIERAEADLHTLLLENRVGEGAAEDIRILQERLRSVLRGEWQWAL